MAAGRLLFSCLFVLGCRSAFREESVRPGINRSYFQEPRLEHWVQRFEAEEREIFARRREIARRVGLKPGSAVADVGAGTGLYTMLFAEATGPSGKVYAVDIVPAFLDHIRARAQEAGLRNVEVVRGREDSVELAEGSVDAAFACDTYHHLEYPRSMLASIRRALRPGGELIVVDFLREEGRSRQWVLDHVRASKPVVISEIQEAGFTLIEDASFLEENYFLRFRRDGS